MRVVRVLPDVPAIDREFDYVVPESWHDDGTADRVAVGSMVRVVLAGRRVGGWITAVDVAPPAGVELAPLAKLSGVGPDGEMQELASWAAWRWAGPRVALMRAASPPRMVASVPARRAAGPVPAGPADVFEGAFGVGVAVVRQGPADDPLPVVLAACRRGDALVVVPEQSGARRLAIALRRAGITVALAPDDWAVAAGGASVVGARSAVWMPMPALAAVVVVDEHDESLKEERTPTWHARDVALERARRRGVPAVLVSPSPSLEALRAGRLLRPNREVERSGWPVVHVLDRRDDDPTRAGPFAERLAEHVRTDGRVLVVLNRKGRSRLLACGTCGELVRTDDGRAPMVLVDDRLTSPDGRESRPIVCAHCGSTSLKNLRMGVTRAAEELAALVGEPVEEVTADAVDPPQSRVVIGTEAVLHRVGSASVVVFLDLDQELLAPRQRATEQAFALVARAARILGRRDDGGRLVLQTRQPDHEVVRAAVRADPSIVAVAERDRRQAAGIPPYGAQALVSGAAAEAFIGSLGRPAGVAVRGPVDGRWLLRAEDHPVLLDALASTPRPGAVCGSRSIRCEYEGVKGRSYLAVLLLVALAALGVVLVATADDGGTELVEVETAEGVVVDVPRGWVVSPEFDFQFVPPRDRDNGLDIWSVAWACPPEGCAARSLAEWLALAPELPTFTSARDDAGGTLLDVEESSDERSWVLTARTGNDLHIVNVAVFVDGADRYLACNLAVLGDPGDLDEAIVDACRSAQVPT